MGGSGQEVNTYLIPHLEKTFLHRIRDHGEDELLYSLHFNFILGGWSQVDYFCLSRRVIWKVIMDSLLSCARVFVKAPARSAISSRSTLASCSIKNSH